MAPLGRLIYKQIKSHYTNYSECQSSEQVFGARLSPRALSDPLAVRNIQNRDAAPITRTVPLKPHTRTGRAIRAAWPLSSVVKTEPPDLRMSTPNFTPKPGPSGCLQTDSFPTLHTFCQFKSRPHSHSEGKPNEVVQSLLFSRRV